MWDVGPEIWDCGLRLSCHMASPSLGHYAALSFIVRGKKSETGQTRGETKEDRRQMTDDSKSNSQFVEWSNGYEWR